jgi:protein-tyrosine phosphatase
LTEVSGQFRWLMVCTGNICRSPMAERLAAAGLAERLGVEATHFEVTSAGTFGLHGNDMEPFAAQVLSALGGDPAGFVARRLDSDLVAAADLVTTATLEHRSIAVSLHPRAASRSFTIRELARLLSVVDLTALPQDDPVARARAMVAAAAAKRGYLPPPAPGADDVKDPYGGPLPAYQACGELLVEALRAPLEAIALRGTTRP